MMNNEFETYIHYDEKNKNIKVAVAMSGGVDSSVTAYILKKQGYDIFGITMITCDTEDQDAARVCEDLGIKHYVIDVRNEFDDKVIKYFVDDYMAGRTPNPCMVCNRFVKFGVLLEKALSLGASFMATGHYAKIINETLVMGEDISKDQVYFLSQIKQENLKHIMFPIGDLEKSRVRELGKYLGVRVYAKKDSQEICFVEDGKLKEFLNEKTSGKAGTPGKIIDKSGKVLGTHKGLAFYTIGQRKGLGISSETPKYVIKMDSKKNALIVGDNDELFKSYLKARDINLFNYKNLSELQGLICFAKTRSKDKLHRCKLEVINDKILKIEFLDEKVRAITPGQGVVLYDEGHRVLASGFII